MPRTRASSRLRVERLESRTLPAVLTFVALADTQLSSAQPNANYGAASAVAVGAAGGAVDQGLIRFDNLFGSGPNEIPAGSTIRSASLTLWSETVATGGKVGLYSMKVAWDPATATWASFGGNGVQTDGTEAASVSDANVTSAATGYQVVDGLAARVQSWLNGAANNGWGIAATGTSSGWSFASAEAMAADLPTLTVDFGPAAAAPRYAALVGEPPSPADAGWLPWEQRLVQARLDRVPSQRQATYYFSQSGDDATGDGSPGRPWKTLAKAQHVLDDSAGDVRLRFRGGDVWRESMGLVVVHDNVTIDSYGNGTAYFNAFTRQYSGGWVRVAGDLWGRAAADSVGWLREAANPLGHVYTQQDSSAHVAGYPLSFFADANGTDTHSGGVPTLYLNAGPGVDPNAVGGGFEATPATTGSFTVNADNVRVENLKVHGAGINPAGNGYGLQFGTLGRGFTEFVGKGLEFYYSGYHAFGHISDDTGGLLVNCVGGLTTVRTEGGTTTFVSYSPVAGREFVMQDCEVSYGALPSYVWGAMPGARYTGSVGVYEHEGLSALSLSVRTRYPDNPGQVVTGTQIAAFGGSTLDSLRAVEYGVRYATVAGPFAGWLLASVNCTYDLHPVGAAVAAFGGPQYGWAVNCTVHADMRDFTGYYTGYGYFYSAGTTINPKLENCRFEAVNLNANEMNLFHYDSTPLGPDTLVRNCVITFDGTAHSGIGIAPDGRFHNNAYKFTPYGPGVPLNEYLAGDTGAVLLTQTPSHAAPSPHSPLYGRGQANGVGFDANHMNRPTGRSDIGPLAGGPLPVPAVVALSWGNRTAVVRRGGGVGWAGVRSVTMTFATDVDVYRDSLAIAGTVAGSYAFSAFSYDATTHMAVWTFAAPVNRDRLTFFFDGAAVFRQTVLPGDVDGNGVVNAADIGRLREALGKEQAAADLNGDGRVTKADIDLVREFLGTSV